MTEKELHQQICDYIRLQYPKVLFNTDLSGIKLTIGQAVRVKKMRSCSGFPDIFIAHKHNNFGGLFLEVKKNYSEIWLKNGEYKDNHHIIDQLIVLNKLMDQGYAAWWAYSFDQAKRTIDSYMNNGILILD
jgi:hypothetical protein